MCVGALLEADVDGIVYALADPLQGACGSVRPAGRPGQRVPGDSAGRVGHPRPGSRRPPARSAWRRHRVAPDGSSAPAAGRVGRHLCYPLARRGVRVVDGAALEKRCAKAPWVRIPPSPPSPFDSDTIGRSSSRPRRGRLVAEGAALEMRYGATHRGFESLPLRHLPLRMALSSSDGPAPCVGWLDRRGLQTYYLSVRGVAGSRRVVRHMNQGAVTSDT